MNKTTFEFERIKLEEIIKIINKVLIEEKIDLKNLYSEFTSNKDELERIINGKILRIKNLETATDKPYFARIDFTSEDDGNTNSIYIGKNGIIDNTEIVVTDWRAPISSLYYDAEVGECSYEAPEGIIKGNMSLKRQFEIESGQLKEFFDVDLVSNDNLLQKYLNTNNDSRLKSIVSTIQKEQNEVIRKKISNNIIIQGVAGSGKTTVALHRIAYLVYNYINSVKQNEYLVIGPNPVFLKYIKSVLPELDVDGVEQCTYENFGKKYINEDININPSNKKAMKNIEKKGSGDIDKYKCSMKYKNMIEKFLEVYIYSITAKPIKIGEFEVVSSDIIKEIFQSTNNGYSNNLNSRIETTIERLSNYIENNIENIKRRYSDYSYELFISAKTDEEKNKLKNIFAKDRAEIAKYCRSTIRKYFNKSKLSSTKLYKLFVSTINDFDIYNYNNLDKLKTETLKNLRNHCYDFEDLASLIYIKLLTAPDKEYKRIKHVVIDEAQDLGEFNFFTLKKALPNSTFSIFGDLAQSIYDYRGISSWDEVNDVMFNNEGDIIQFNKSYRTTAQIMDAADDVAESIDLNRSDVVVRNGEAVNLTEIEQEENIPAYIANKIREYKEKGYKTIAVISKTELLSNYINDDLVSLGLNLPNVTENDDLNDEKFRICTISNQLAKGLEFDAVIINNTSERIYSSENVLDMKLLYVAITRALHELDIVYSGTLTKPLLNQLKKQEEKKLIKTKNY